MVIGFNAKAAFTPQRTGVDQYVYWFIKALINKPPHPENKFIFYTDKLPKNQTLSDLLDDQIPSFIQIKVMPAKYLWTQGRLAYELFKNPPDVFFTPAHVLPLTAPLKSVVTIHDLAFEYYPELYHPLSVHYLKQVTKMAVYRAAKIIAVSENTKNDLINLYGVNTSKISVIYHGVPDFNIKQKEYKDIKLEHFQDLRQITGQPYILFIGRIELKKNIKNLIRSFNLLNEELKKRVKEPINLVLVGAPGYGYQAIMKFINASPFKENIFLTGHLQGSKKEAVLKNAKVLALLSYYEGFGLPVLEAQSVGVPVVCSANSSLPEVAGHGAMFCRVDDVKGIADAFYQVLTSNSLRIRLVKRGFENAKRFSWDQCVSQTLEVLLNW